MNYTTYINGALDFAVKYEAVSLTIELDAGKLDMTPREAEDYFDDIALGETFTIISINFAN